MQVRTHSIRPVPGYDRRGTRGRGGAGTHRVLRCRFGGRRRSRPRPLVPDRGHVGRAGHGRDRSAHGHADRAGGRTLGFADRAGRDRSAHGLADRAGRCCPRPRSRAPARSRRRVGHAGAGADPQACSWRPTCAPSPVPSPPARQGGLAVLPRPRAAPVPSPPPRTRGQPGGAEPCPVPARPAAEEGGRSRCKPRPF